MLVQVDRLAQCEKSFGAVLLHVVVAAREQVFLDREAKSVRIAHRRPAETQLEFHRTAVRRHRQRARKLQPRRSVASCDRFADDLPLHAAPRRRQHLRLVGGAQDDDAPHECGMARREAQGNHAAVGGADDGVQRLAAPNAERCGARLPPDRRSSTAGICRRAAARNSRRARRDNRCRARGICVVSTPSPGPTISGHQPSAPQTMRCAEIPPITAMTGASSGPTKRKAMRAFASSSP